MNDISEIYSRAYSEGVEHGPYIIEDEAAFIAASPRRGRMSGIEEMEGEIRQSALQNHAALLAALAAYEDGLISQEAWQELRVAASRRHQDLIKLSYKDTQVASDYNSWPMIHYHHNGSLGWSYSR